MRIYHDISLSKYSTMRLGGKATALVKITDKHELVQALNWAHEHSLPSLVIGGGSNIIWSDKGYDGLVIINKIKNFKITNDTDRGAYVHVGAGENWDDVVKRCVAKNLSGIEALSLIPGSSGATPIQNVGAYGQEIADTLVSVEAYDSLYQRFVTITSHDCRFGYRTSRFKTTDRNRFYIIGLLFHLKKQNPKPPFYSSLQRYLDSKNIRIYTPQIIRQAVIDIRSSKLPDPAKVANNGSFFANPIVSRVRFVAIEASYPGVAHWETGDGKVKISAAWLLENAGFKNHHDKATGMATWPKQPLVLVNEHAKYTADLLMFKEKIIKKVQKQFGIKLEQEPLLLGNKN